MVAQKYLAFILILGATILAAPDNASVDLTQRTKAQAHDVDAEQRIAELGLKLPAPAPSLAIYKRVVIVDKMVYLSGHIPLDDDGKIMTGKVGREVDVELAAKAARQCAIGLLASLRAELGSLNRVRRLVRTTGMVNCTDDFVQQPEVINGCSQLLVDVFGEESGKGTRAAVGMNALPRGAICEIDMIFELKE